MTNTRFEFSVYDLCRPVAILYNHIEQIFNIYTEYLTNFYHSITQKIINANRNNKNNKNLNFNPSFQYFEKGNTTNKNFNLFNKSEIIQIPS